MDETNSQNAKKLADGKAPSNEKTPAAGATGEVSAVGAIATNAKAIPQPAASTNPPIQISFDDFAKLDIRVAKITAAERVESASKLYKLTIDIGGEARTLAAGVVQFYAPEELVGKSVIVISNLAPRTIRGIASQGMMLAAEDAAGNVCVLTTDRQMPPGSKIR
jgi:methionyl-tRNA synthetase